MTHGARAYQHLLVNVPDFLDYSPVLYVGAKRTGLRWLPELHDAGATIDVIEIFPANVATLLALNQEKAWFRNIYLGDLMNLGALTGHAKWPLVVWSHGPEHVRQEDLPKALDCVEDACSRLAVLACPHGPCGWGGEIDGNLHDRHMDWDCVPEAFEALGWTAATLLPEPGKDSHLIAWKRIANDARTIG